MVGDVREAMWAVGDTDRRSGSQEEQEETHSFSGPLHKVKCKKHGKVFTAVKVQHCYATLLLPLSDTS